MKLLTRISRFKSIIGLHPRYCTHSIVDGKVSYPPILDLSPEECDKRKRQELFNKYKDLHTVEEKLFALNLPRYYGWNSVLLKEGEYPYDVLPLYQYITRTQIFRQVESLEGIHGVSRDLCKEIVNKIRNEVQEALMFELKGRRFQEREEEKPLPDRIVQNNIAELICDQIHRVILSKLSSDYSYLLESTVDYKPRVEAFWTVGGFHPSEPVVRDELEQIENKRIKEKVVSNKVDELWLQYFSQPCFQVRCSDPLKPLNTSLAQDSAANIPLVDYDPASTFGFEMERRHGTNIAGFWPGDKDEFGLLSYHTCGHLLDRPPHFGQDETKDTLTAQALMASFAWLHAQASYQGFSTFHELTYPLVTQTVLTDGKAFSFYLYQLNTTVFYADNVRNNPRTNHLYFLPHLPLYQDIDQDKFVDWNDSVLENLVSFYLNKPEVREGVVMKPFVQSSECHLSDINEKERRVWLHNQFRHMYSNRPRKYLPYEIYDWERIYKIKFDTLPLDKRTRPFELDQNPLEDRRYYDHKPPYIPRSIRGKKKHWKAWRANFAKTYYPEIEF